MWNSKQTNHSIDYLAKQIQNNDTLITGLSFKFNYLPFEHLLKINDSLTYNKTLVRLDLSNNRFQSSVVGWLLRTLENNKSLADLNLSSNLLNDEFATSLANCLEKNQILFKVDISNNPIGPDGAKVILSVLLSENDTLGSLGDLSTSVSMGVRVREELSQALTLNSSNHEKRKDYITQAKLGTAKTFLDGDKLAMESGKSKH